MSEEVKETKNEDIKVRALNTEDLFTLIDISADMDTNSLVDKVTDLVKSERAKYKVKNKEKELTKEESNEIQTKVSIKFALIIIQNLGKAKDKFYKLLSDISGISAKEIRTQSITKTINIIVQLVQQEEFNDFFSQITNKEL